MEWLNYHHLLYFWVVAREGSVSKASQELRLAQPTISGQIRALENSLGEKLFARSGRNLVLTEMGRVVYGYAEEIFSLGRELIDTIKDRPSGRPVRFTVGITDAVPKFIAYRLLEPALTIPEQIRMICREDKPENLLGELSIHNLDLVITDAPIGPTMKVKAFNHLLGECGVSIYGTQKLMNSAKKNFPKSLHGLPFLMPSEASALRRQLEQWFDSQNIRVRVAGEFDDTALMSAFGQAGAGVFCAPTVIEKEIQDQYGLKVIGRLPQVRERYYAISVERKLKHPAVIAISESAKQQLFTETGMRESARAASNE